MHALHLSSCKAIEQQITIITFEPILLCFEFHRFDFADALFWNSGPFLRCFSQGSGIQKAKTKTTVDLNSKNEQSHLSLSPPLCY